MSGHHRITKHSKQSEPILSSQIQSNCERPCSHYQSSRVMAVRSKQHGFWRLLRITRFLKKLKTTGWHQIGALGKLHNLAVHIRSSEQRYNWFYELAGVALGLDNDTRWNS